MKPTTLHLKLGAKARDPERSVNYKSGRAFDDAHRFTKDDAPLKVDGAKVTFRQAPEPDKPQ